MIAYSLFIYIYIYILVNQICLKQIHILNINNLKINFAKYCLASSIYWFLETSMHHLAYITKRPEIWMCSFNNFQWQEVMNFSFQQFNSFF
jgi:hypothetical protein